MSEDAGRPTFVDLHTHSTASDGTLTPEQVIESAQRCGLAALALTDHDTIAGIAADKNEARVTLTGIADAPGMVAKVISPLAEAGILVDMIVHAATPNTGSSDLTFTVPRASLAQAMAVIEQRKSAIGYAELIDDGAVAKVSIVGVGIRSNPGLAAKMFETLAERQINLLAVSSSEIKVSALIAEAELDLAVRVLHTAFGLDADA